MKKEGNKEKGERGRKFLQGGMRAANRKGEKNKKAERKKRQQSSVQLISVWYHPTLTGVVLCNWNRGQ